MGHHQRAAERAGVSGQGPGIRGDPEQRVMHDVEWRRHIIVFHLYLYVDAVR